MAGNTKFKGFGVEGMVTLSRWGEEANVELSKESISALRQACYFGLPKKPSSQPRSVGTRVSYDENTGIVVVQLDPKKALELGSFLEENTSEATLASNLKSAHAEHVAYNDVSEEPGTDERKY